ncbi:uncharacterized protein LOC124827058 [Vigna umbellata]|uniref:uncharacterized protein LOC124827058 n=1 Tax=Vigna umbellata TaxID=87088 RepID=UPI001F5ECBAA|nr:uncharacterized protein LOC124827058 [Vigna umbellata]
MVDSAIRRHSEQEAEDSSDEESPNEITQRFYNLLADANKPVFDGSSESKLSVCIKLMACKSNWNVPNQAMDFISKLILELTPVNNSLPKNYYEAKQCVSKLGLEAKKIDCCLNGCMLFYDNDNGKNDASLVQCKFCGQPRFQTIHPKRRQKKPIPFKYMFYLPIIPRLQRMFASMQTAEHMTWHDGKKNEGMLRHPSNGEAWKHFNRKHPSFASDARNVRLGLCSDGFTPYIQASKSPYSCCPVIVTPYNLPPEMCMTKPYMFLTCIIPDPSNPKASIDVYLEPLIDDLKKLWSGVWTYDVSKKQNFLMRAALMWTISGFPAYDMLSGWSTHGRLACPHCMEHTKSFSLSYGRKNSWFDCHRRFLRMDHMFRKNKKAFRKGEVETDLPPPRLNPSQVWRRVKHFPKVTESGINRIEGFGEWHNWTKRSIFWDLSYWKDNLLRHNLDVMHIEKNFFDNIFNTVMNVGEAKGEFLRIKRRG